MADGTAIEIGTGTVFDIPPGHDGWVIGDEPWVTYDFAGMRAFGRPAEAGERTLASILFTDIVGSTETAERVGDRAWRELIGQLNERTQFEVDRYRGRLIKTTGDGVLAVFDGAERTVRAAAAICLAAKAMGIAIRAGVHTGEVEVRGDDLGGIAVHIAARVAASAVAGEILVSSTVKDLVAGSGIQFADRGVHDLKGVPGAWRLFAVEGTGPEVGREGRRHQE
jgi:class 3 adenylate cyclase